MADCVTHYVAERIIERERAMEGDWLIKRGGVSEESRGRSASCARGSAPAFRCRPEIRDRGAIGWVLAGLLARHSHRRHRPPRLCLGELPDRVIADGARRPNNFNSESVVIGPSGVAGPRRVMSQANAPSFSVIR